MQILDTIKNVIKGMMVEMAKTLDEISNGAIKPIHITYLSLFGHIFVFLAIIAGLYLQAALFLIIFGLMDSLDGALARVQKRESDSGVLLDSSFDRVKEAMIYMAIAYVLADQYGPIWALWSVAAISGSMAVSYFKAKGETIISANKKLKASELNQLFRSGLMSYEIRMTIIVVGLLFDQLQFAVVIVAFFSWLTAFYRLALINKAVSDDKN